MFARIAGITALVLVCSLTSVIRSQQKSKPLDEPGVLTLLELGFDDETIVDRIKEAGLAFQISDEFVEKLKAAKASEVVVKTVQEAGKTKAAPAADGDPPITFDQVLKMLALRMKEDKVLQRIARTPPVFVLSAAQEDELVQAGATPKVIAALKGDRPLPAAAAELITNFALVLDCSGSMRETTKEGVTKMEAAKRVMTELIKKIPNGLNVTFVIYGHEVFGKADDPRNCQAVKVARPLSKLDDAGKAELSELVAGLKPTGGTPIALSLKVTGQELAKDKDAFCGIVLITDGLESCKGNPTEEVAALLGNLKLSFGVNVVGLGVKADEDAALKAIAEAGKGKYYDADDAGALAESISEIAKELEVKAKPADKKVTMRRAIIVHKPAIEEFPALGEIRLISRGLGTTSTDGMGGYEEEIRVPSDTTKYEILWVPMDKEMSAVAILRDRVFAERKLVEIKPEDYLGMVRITGKGKPKKGIVVSRAGGLGSTERATECKRFGQVLVVPAGKWDIWIDDNKIEEGFEVEPGKLHELE
jgi:hypothetical protein